MDSDHDEHAQPASDTDPAHPDTEPNQHTPAPAEPLANGEPGQGAPPAAPAAAPGPTPTVALPDGSATTAKTPALARAVRDYLTGTPVDAAYRSAGIELPPPGTPVTDPADPAQLSCGFLGMFTDHYVVAASAVKAIADGQVIGLSSVTSSPNFLGWIDPTTLPAAQPPPIAEPPGTPAAPAPPVTAGAG